MFHTYILLQLPCSYVKIDPTAYLISGNGDFIEVPDVILIQLS